MLIQSSMTLLDIFAKYSQTIPIFREYDDVVGQCLLCNHLFDSIELVTKKYQLDETDMLQKLNEAAHNHSIKEESSQESD